MLEFTLECTYCGYIWNESFYSEYQLKSAVCSKCKDKHLKVKKRDRLNIYEDNSKPPSGGYNE